MKKALLATATLSVLLTTGAAFAQVTEGSDGNINFVGAVTNAACSVSDLTIDLGKPTVHSLQAAKSTGDEKTASLVFDKCQLMVAGDEGESEVVPGTANSVALSILSGDKLPNHDDIWLSTGSAQNVGVKVIIQSQPVTPEGTKEPIVATINEGAATYTVMGQIVSAGEATSGSVATTLKFKADYK